MSLLQVADRPPQIDTVRQYGAEIRQAFRRHPSNRSATLPDTIPFNMWFRRKQQLQEAEAAAEANARRASEAEAAAAHLRMEAAEEATSRLRTEEEERAGVAATTELTNLIRHGRTFYTFVYAKSMYNSSVQFMNV